MANSRESNVQFITRVMEFARSGPLMQAFIIDALGKHADTIAALTDEDLKGADWDATRAMMNPHLWREVARELKRELDAKYGSNNRG